MIYPGMTGTDGMTEAMTEIVETTAAMTGIVATIVIAATTGTEETIAAMTGTGEMTVGKETTHQSPQPSNFCSEKNLSQLLFF